MKNANILIVEDDDLLAESLRRRLSKKYEISLSHTVATAKELLFSQVFDLIILDMKLPDGEGFEILEILKDTPGDTIAIAVTAFPEVQLAVKTLKMGAYDYINKPFDLEDLELVIERALNVKIVTQNFSASKIFQNISPLEKIKGKSKCILDLKENILNVAKYPETTVLITGETGTGKELVAEAIHSLSERASRPLIKINCSSIPEHLFESELFGFEKGAFTDAKTSKKGLIEIASGGIIFFDEIGELPLSIQPKLLRFIESKTFFKLGAHKETKVDVGIIAATNRDLEQMVKDGKFRKDLFYRLNVINLHIEPLRKRKDDIVEIAEYYLDYFRKKLNKPEFHISKRQLDKLREYSWPGNVRELKNFMERSVIYGCMPKLSNVSMCDDSENLKIVPLNEYVNSYILKVFKNFDNNVTKTANALGISRQTLRKKLGEMGVIF